MILERGISRPLKPIKELLKNGVLIVDKPQGPSSHQVSAWVKNIFGVEKAGHGGTLDPNVTGVLPIALMDATKALDALLQGDKEYVCAMKLHADVKKENLISVFKEFTGNIYQTPPLKSAVKKELRTRTVHGIDVLEIEHRDVLFTVRCQAGTYIRVLCHDIGDALLTGAHMEGLRRTRVANLKEADSVSLQDVKDAYEHWKDTGEEAHLRELVLPMEVLLDHLPKVVLKDTAVDAICHGADLAIPGIAHMDKKIKRGDHVAMMSMKGEGVALGIALLDHKAVQDKSTGVAVDTKRVLMSLGTYPKAWKSKSKLLNSKD